jgi:hypothetical protein
MATDRKTQTPFSRQIQSTFARALLPRTSNKVVVKATELDGRYNDIHSEQGRPAEPETADGVIGKAITSALAGGMPNSGGPRRAVEKASDASEKRDKDGKWTGGGIAATSLGHTARLLGRLGHVDDAKTLRSVAAGKPSSAGAPADLERVAGKLGELGHRDHAGTVREVKRLAEGKHPNGHAKPEPKLVDARSMTTAQKIENFKEMHGRAPTDAEMRGAGLAKATEAVAKAVAAGMTGSTVDGEASDATPAQRIEAFEADHGRPPNAKELRAMGIDPKDTPLKKGGEFTPLAKAASDWEDPDADMTEVAKGLRRVADTRPDLRVGWLAALAERRAK